MADSAGHLHPAAPLAVGPSAGRVRRAWGRLFEAARQLVRAHAFRLAGLYFLVFAVSMIGVLLFVYWTSADFVEPPDRRDA